MGGCDREVIQVDKYTVYIRQFVVARPWPGGHEVLFVATSDRLPSHPTKDGEPQYTVQVYYMHQTIVVEVIQALQQISCHREHHSWCRGIVKKTQIVC